MNIKEVSNEYSVKKLTEDDLILCYNLMKTNPLYFEHCPPKLTKDTPKNDMYALPPNKTYEDKYYIGFFLEKELIAIADIILKYPNNETVFLGFFMVDQKYQGKNIGSKIINEIEKYFGLIGYSYIRLGYVQTNPQSKKFWEKNKYIPTGLTAKTDDYDIVIMEKRIKRGDC